MAILWLTVLSSPDSVQLTHSHISGTAMRLHGGCNGHFVVNRSPSHSGHCTHSYFSSSTAGSIYCQGSQRKLCYSMLNYLLIIFVPCSVFFTLKDHHLYTSSIKTNGDLKQKERGTTEVYDKTTMYVPYICYGTVTKCADKILSDQ